MDSAEAKQKALEVFKEKGGDKSLIQFWVKCQHYGAWAKNQADFEENWNIGITNISSEDKFIQVGSENKKVEFLSGEIQRHRFKLGGYTRTDGLLYGGSIEEVVILFLGETIAVIANYQHLNDDACIASDYKLSSIDEFHFSNELFEVLDISDRLISKYDKRKTDELMRMRESQYKDKFSF